MPIVEIIDEQHWRDLRSHHVGASDVAALFPCDSFMSHFELWAEKSGKLPPSEFDCERVDLGKEFEWPVIATAAKRNGWQLAKPEGYYIHNTVKGMGCTPDALLVDELGRKCLAEVKFADYAIFKKEWVDGEPPLKYLLQLQHQLACTGYEYGKIVVYVIGSGLKIYDYERHEKTITMIEQAVTKFWQDVQEGKEPKLGEGDYDVVRAIYANPNGETLDLTADNELPELCALYTHVNKERLAAEKEEKRLKAEIINKVGNAVEATTSGYRIKYPEIVKNMKAKEAHVQRFRQLTIKEVA